MRLVHSLVLFVLLAFIGQLVASYFAVNKNAIEWNEADHDDDAEDQENSENDWIADNFFMSDNALDFFVKKKVGFNFKSHATQIEFYLLIDNPPETWS